MQNKKTWKATFQAFWYILPLFIIIGVFNIYPIIKSFAMAFYEDFNIFSGEIGGYGLTNFETLVSDEEFAEALMNTFVYVLFVTPISIILALAVAILLNNIKRLKPIFQSIYFLPFIEKISGLSPGTYIHMNGEPLGDYDPRYEIMQTILQRSQFEFKDYSVSGHASKADILTIAESVNPQRVVPWHTFEPEKQGTALRKNGMTPFIPKKETPYLLSDILKP